MLLGSLRLLAILCVCGLLEASGAALNTTEACDEPSLVQLNSAEKEDQGLAGRRRRRRRSRRRRTRRRRTSSSDALPYILQAYCGGDWLTDCTDVPSGWQQHNGAFSDQGIDTTPPDASADSDADNNYISIGGAGVSGDLPGKSTVEGWLADDSINSNNLDFDMEGSIAGEFSDVWTLVQEVKADYPDLKAQVTCLVSTVSTAEEYANDFDYFGIMIHGNTMTSGSYSIPCDSGEDPTTGGTWPYIKEWIESDIPNSKIILSLTTVDLTACMVDWFKSLIAEYGLAGMSFWYWNQLDTSSITTECIESQSVQCDSSDDFKCTAACNGGSANGQCCEKTDTTTVGNCTLLGQEGCCGGTADTTYCQAV